MKHLLKPVFALVIFAILTSASAQAETREKMIIALKTTDFELTQTDISTLAIGEAKTIETESGKVIDILRTADGAEIYVDGELLEMNFDDEGLHEEHMVKKHVEIICEDGEECDKNVFIIKGDDNHTLDLVGEDGKNIFIHKEVELSCTDDEDGTSCSEQMVWISDGEEIKLDELHKMHQDSEGHKVIVIKKKIVAED
jgi:hypothetical protein